MNRLHHPTILILIAAGVLAASPVLGQIPSYYVFRPEGLNMRQAALGDASCSEAYDVAGMFGNPASLNHLRETGVILTHVLNEGSHAQTDQVTLAVFSGTMFALAVNATYTHGGELRPEGFSPFPIKETGGITGEERLREHLGSVYQSVIGAPGPPNRAWLDRIEALGKDIAVADRDTDALIAKQLAALNPKLKAAKLAPLEAPAL